jgi:hypothetical protein
VSGKRREKKKIRSERMKRREEGDEGERKRIERRKTEGEQKERQRIVRKGRKG